ncbi:hypothetical protein ACM64Y_10260 [Novispirillum sp. DQ9]|uniref:hypothetical protein n=1 Tax=Novispirillum sp. DQ9 TaxID=3398612 RepID=UPI003C7BD5E4
MRRTVLVVAMAGLLAGCLNNGDPQEVAGFIDSVGSVLGAAEACDPRLAARATACARHKVATWPGGLDDGERLAALLRLDEARRRAVSSRSCETAARSLRDSPLWAGCYSRPST